MSSIHLRERAQKLADEEATLGAVKVDKQQSWSEKYFGWISHTTVEPVIWLFGMSNAMISVVEQAFFVDKSCRINHGFSEEICNNLDANMTLQTQVQVTVSNFHQYNNIVRFIFPIVLAPFFGNWSDRRGRKAPLLVALTGKVIHAVMLVVNSLMDTWKLHMVIWTASLVMEITGTDVIIFASSYSYISDVSSMKQLTLRMSILGVVNLSTAPIGVALGSYLYYNVANTSYVVMFAIEAAVLTLTILYATVRLKMRTTAQQRPLEKGKNLVVDFFDKKHVAASWNTLTKARPARRRLYVWIILLAIILFAFQREETPITYLYTQLTFSWTVSSFSQFRTFQSSLYFVSMLFGVPLMSKVLGMRDTLIVAVACLSHAAGRVLFATATTPQLFYAGAGITALGPTGVPVLRSLTSKLVHPSERGKILAIVAVLSNAAGLVSGTMYSWVYNATITTAPSSIYWLVCAAYTVVLVLIIGIHVSLESMPLNSGGEQSDEFHDPEFNEPPLGTEKDESMPDVS